MLWRRHAPPEELQVPGFDMTPMIDCTFQLIIFFMLVMDMSSQQVEKMTPPTASRAVKDDDPTELVVNCMPDGKVRVQGKALSDDALDSLFASRKPRPGGLDTPVLIRADRSTPFETVQKVMMSASHHGAVTRLRFGARKE
jgi:biopolymer transport protein ExbD